MGPNPSSSDRIRLLNPLEVAGWDQQVAALPGATLFHGTPWAGVLRDTYGYQPVYLASFNRERLEALVPFMEVKSWLTGKRGVSLPFSDVVEPLATDEAVLPEMLRFAQDLGRRRGWKHLELRGGERWLKTETPSTSFFWHRLGLAPGEKLIFRQCDEATRRSIRKAEQGGLQLDFSSTPENMQAFYRLLCLTRRRHGVPPQPFRFFAEIFRRIIQPAHGWLVLARQGTEAVAGAVFLLQGRQALYKFGASARTHDAQRPNHLVMWGAIRRCLELGMTGLDFGRTSLDNAGLRRFKLGWGAAEEVHDYFRYDLRRSRFVRVPDRSSGWHSQVFRHLPLPASRLIGATLYRHLG